MLKCIENNVLLRIYLQIVTFINSVVMKKVFTLLGALLLWQSVAVAQNYLHIWTGDSTKVVPVAELDSVTFRDRNFYVLTPTSLDGKHYTGRVADAWNNSSWDFDVTISAGESDTLCINTLDPYFAQYGYVAAKGYNILKGKFEAAADGRSGTITCPAGQLMGYDDCTFICPNDLTSPIVFTVTESELICTTGYAVYTVSQGGYFTAFYSFTLGRSHATQVPVRNKVTSKPQIRQPQTQPQTSTEESNSTQLLLYPGGQTID